MVGEKYASTFKLKHTRWSLSFTAIETTHNSKILKWSWCCLNTNGFLPSAFTSWASLTFSLSVAWYWMKQAFIIDSNSAANGRSPSCRHFPILLEFKNTFRQNTARKILLLSACYIWNDRVSLREMDQKFPIGGLIGYGNSYLDSKICYSKVFRLHAILNDAAGAVRLQTSKGPGYWYMTARGPNICLLGHVTGLIFCLYGKNFLPSNFRFFDFCNRVSLIVLDIKLTEKHIVKDLGLFIDWSLQGFSFSPPKTYKPDKQTTWNTSHLRVAWSSGKLKYDKLFAVFCDINVMNAEVFPKGLEKCRLLTRLLG